MNGRCLITFVISTLTVVAAGAAEPTLLRLERRPGLERNQLLDAGLPVVEESDGAFLALGDEVAVTAAARSLGLSVDVVDHREPGFTWLVANLVGEARAEELGACGELLLVEGRWALLKALEPVDEACAGDTRFRTRPLRQKPLGRWRDAGPVAGGRLDAKPMVTDMVNALSEAMVVGHWSDVVDVAPERFSNVATYGGCQDAVDLVAGRMSDYGLAVTLDDYRANYAPNVVGTLSGVTTPEQVYVVIGHLDSTSSTSVAPGADDNASGSAMVVALAEVMARYRYASTIQFIAVTGEEQGLYGSTALADAAAAAGTDIRGVLNADMVSWQGNGVPAGGEDLDLIYNTASSSLRTTFVEAAAAYPTGLAVKALSCNNMAQSDHWPYWSEGYQALCGITDDEGICGGGGSYPYYHSPNDTVANCGNPAFYGRVAKAYLATLAHLADPLCALPEPPATANAVAAGANQVALSWQSAGPGLVYEVFRAPGGCGGPLAWAKIGETTATGLTDTTASGGVSYAYALRAVNGACPSALGACFEGATSGACTEAPHFAGAAAVSDDHTTTCGLTVSWPAATPYCGAGVSYSVYRSTDPAFTPSPATLVASGLTTTTFDDLAALAPGVTMSYVVRAVDSGNGVADANLVRRSAAPSGPYTLGSWADDAGDSGVAKLVTTAPWTAQSSGGHTAPKVYATGAYDDLLCAGATTPTLHLGSGAQLAFWSHHELESGWDKGEVQISTDAGGSWTRVSVAYPTSSSYTSDACGLPAGSYFTGTGATWTEYGASLAAWADQDVQLRWVLSSDTSVNGDGWWVDDLGISDVMVPGSCSPGSASAIFADGFEGGGTGAWSYALP